MDGHGRLARGRDGEEAAAAYLEREGIRVVDRDVRFKQGQVDLVGLDGDRLVIVEVKARRGRAFGMPEEAVHRRKLAKLRELAVAYRQAHPRLGRGLRIDVVAIDLDAAGAPAAIRHLRDVSD